MPGGWRLSARRPVDGQAEAIALAPHDRGVPDRGIGIEGLDVVAERGEHLRGRGQQALLAASVGQPLKAIADLGDNDRRA